MSISNSFARPFLKLLTASPILLLLALCVIPPHTARAQDVARDRGELYVSIDYATISANTIFQQDGSNVQPFAPPASVRDYPWAMRSVFVSAEYGIGSKLAIFGGASLKRVIVTTPVARRAIEGIGDVELGAQTYLVMRDRTNFLALDIASTIPTGYTSTTVPALGTGTLDLAFGVEGRRNLDTIETITRVPAYVAASLGTRLRLRVELTRASDYAPQFALGVEAGVILFDRLALRAIVCALTTTRIDTTAFDITRYPETEQYVKAGAGASITLNKYFALNGEVLATPLGRSTPKSLDLRLGLSFTSRPPAAPASEPSPIEGGE
jgi:hypothetical protein